MTLLLSATWCRTRQNCRRGGLLASCSKTFYTLLRKLAGIEVAHVLRLDLTETPGPRNLRSDLEYRFMTADEVLAAAAEPGHDLDSAMADRLGWGWNFCFGVFAGERLVNYAWYADRSPEPEHSFFVSLRLPPCTLYEYKAFTSPEFRGQGIHGDALWRAAEHFRQRGFVHLLAITDCRNWASLRSHEKLGFRRVGRLITFRQRPLACTYDASVCARAFVSHGIS